MTNMFWINFENSAKQGKTVVVMETCKRKLEGKKNTLGTSHNSLE